MFVNRERELAALSEFWSSGTAQCIPVMGRRRVGKTFLLEHFASGRRTIYHRCHRQSTPEQLVRLGTALAGLFGDDILQAEPPTTWNGIFRLIERLAQRDRLLLVLDEIPYWVARDDSVPSILQNWWDERGHSLNLMLVLCGSAIQMMERLLTGQAPLAGCVTGRMMVRPFNFRAAAALVGYTDPTESVIAYGILGGVPLYLTFFRPDRSIRENILRAITSPAARLYVEPQAVFATSHESFSPDQAVSVLRAIAQRNHQWSDIQEATKLAPQTLQNVMNRLIGEMGLVERLLPVTELRPSRAYFTQYRLTDEFFRFWFSFIEPNQDHIEFGDAERVVDMILAQLPDYLGDVFEEICRDWVRLASAAGALPVRVGRVGTWWNANHQIDVVGLDEQRKVALIGECKWTSRPFDWEGLENFQDHVHALGHLVRPDAKYYLFSKTGFADSVRRWADATGATLCVPADLFVPFARHSAPERA